MRKKIGILFFLVLASAGWLLAGQTSNDNCYTILVGKKASADGSVIVAHNEDDTGDIIVNLRKIQARSDAAPRKVSLGKGGFFETDGRTAEFLWIEATTQEFADSFINQYGVVITSDSCTSRETKADLTDGGIGYMLRRLLAEKAKSAREAVKLAGSLIEKYGYTASGRTYTLADKNEIWMMAVIRGRHWFAERVPDDEVAVIPNHYIIRRIRPADKEFFMGSPDIVDYARKNGWYDEAKDGPFDFKTAFNRPAGSDLVLDRNTLRQWRGLSLLSGQKWEISDAYPFSFKPAKKVVAESLMGLLRDHYEGTEYDVTDGYKTGTPNKTKFRTICTSSTITSFIAVLNGKLPEPISAAVWLAVGKPDTTVYLPLYYGVENLPPSAGLGTRTPDDEVLYRQHFDDAEFKASRDRLLHTKVLAFQKIAEASYAPTLETIKRDLFPVEEAFIEGRARFESEFAALYAKDKKGASAKLDAYVADAFEKTAALYDKILAKAPAAAAPAKGPLPPSLFSGLRWRLIGPFRGGRVNAVSGVPGEPETFYYGSVGGGLWKSSNAGRTWVPVFDSQLVASIGAIGVAPSNPAVIYVGTGEADMRDSIAPGDGLYKSVDAGRTWKHVGLDATRQIGRVLVHPKNPDIVFVAALGHAYGPSPDRGVYRSRDGGATWRKVLYKTDGLGAADLALDPADPKTVYAAMWATRRPPWYVYAPSNGPGGGIYKSTDGGDTWKPLTAGLPAEGVGRIGLAVAPANARRVYAVVDAKEGGFFRSDDAGATWAKASAENRIWGRGWYFGKVTVDPKNADIVYVSNTALYKSTDAGKTWTPIKGAPGGDDYHQLWISPDDPRRMIVASDQGAVVTVDGAATWSSWYNQSTAQLYHVAADFRSPYWVTGAQQDSGAVGTPVRSPHAEISEHEWTGLGAGGESGYTAPDPLHPDILYGGTVSRWNVVTGASQNVSPERGASGGPFRHAWTQPLVFSAADPRALYFANQYLYKTLNGGESWTAISPDLTREDPGVPPNLDPAAAAAAPANARRGVIYTIAPSPVSAPTVWIGTDDGLIQVTTDDGATWRNVTPPDVTPWSKVTMIDASHFEANEAYAAVERHQLEDYEPYLYRTRDAGKSWQRIVKGLPAGVYLQTVKEDPVRRGLLFAGTELGLFVSFDDGDDWQPLQFNLPPASMRDLAVHGDDLIVATHGRGFWVLDDITALRQIDETAAGSDAFLFQPADVVSTPPPSENGTPQPKDEPFADNPPFGAPIDYYLKSDAPGPVSLEILDAAGQTVRRYASDDKPAAPNPASLNVAAVWVATPATLPASAGMHRWVWDLRPTPPAGGGQRGAPAGGGGGFGGRGGAPVVQPGAYTVKLTAEGKSYSRPLTVKPDPRQAVK